jgi:hypothetical protein
MDRLLVHPMPGVAFTDPSKNLPYASAIRLDHQVRDVQGCDFVTATQLLCSSDDPDGALVGVTKPLLQVDLSGAPNGGRRVWARHVPWPVAVEERVRREFRGRGHRLRRA